MNRSRLIGGAAAATVLPFALSGKARAADTKGEFGGEFSVGDAANAVGAENAAHYLPRCAAAKRARTRSKFGETATVVSSVPCASVANGRSIASSFEGRLGNGTST